MSKTTRRGLPDYRTRGWKDNKWTREVIQNSKTFAALMFVAFIIVGSLVRGGAVCVCVSPIWILFPIWVQRRLYRKYIEPSVSSYGAPPAQPIPMQSPTYDWSAQPDLGFASAPATPRPPSLISLTPKEFEHEIAFILRTLRPGYRIEVTGGAGDGGIDLTIYDPYGILLGIVQAKRYSPERYVSPSALRDLDSCRRRLGVRHALLVTTATFSQETWDAARAWDIALWDGEQLAHQRQVAYARLAKANNRPTAIPAQAQPRLTPQQEWDQFAQRQIDRIDSLSRYEDPHKFLENLRERDRVNRSQGLHGLVQDMKDKRKTNYFNDRNT